MSGADLLPSILGIVLVAAAAAFVLLPFARGAQLEVAPSVASDSDTPDRLAIYHQVLELEFDHQLGKLSAEDFQQLSAELLAEAGQALREERGSLGEIDDEIEREIAAAREAFATARDGRGKKPTAARARAVRTRS